MSIYPENTMTTPLNMFQIQEKKTETPLRKLLLNASALLLIFKPSELRNAHTSSIVLYNTIDVIITSASKGTFPCVYCQVANMNRTGPITSIRLRKIRNEV